MKTAKRFLIITLVFALIIFVLPHYSIKADATTLTGYCGDYLTYSLNTNTGVLTISGSGYMYDFDNPPWFDYGYAIRSVSLPTGLKNIGENAFVVCTQLTSITIPYGVQTIGDWAFAYSNLETISIPDSVTYIGNRAFDHCTSLGYIYLPAGVTEIGNYVFAYCTSLFYIDVDPNNQYFTSDNGFLFDKKLMTLYAGPNLFAEGYEYPSTMMFIGTGAFVGSPNLSGDYVPASVFMIGTAPWADCENLESIDVDSENMYYYSVNGVVYTTLFTYGLSLVQCPGGKTGTILIEQGTKRIEDRAFQGCSKLTRIYIPESVEKIGYACFEGCGSLPEISIPNSVTSIGGYAFGRCQNLKSICIYNPDCEIFPNENTLGVPSKTIITGYNGSTAQVYARTYGFRFASLGDPPAQNMGIQFVDVKNPSDYYYNPVYWAVGKGITKGTSDTTFSPNDGCTRAQVVTFLWRAMGSPAPNSSYNPMKDVNSNAYYAKAVLWAVEKEITTGTSTTTFSPNDTCTRAQIVTFLWRALGRPSPASSTNPFVDVSASAYYRTAVLWASSKGITKGTSATEFSPSKTCTRGQVVTFLYRSMN